MSADIESLVDIGALDLTVVFRRATWEVDSRIASYAAEADDDGNTTEAVVNLVVATSYGITGYSWEATVNGYAFDCGGIVLRREEAIASGEAFVLAQTGSAK
jgi:hypothetical protein